VGRTSSIGQDHSSRSEGEIPEKKLWSPRTRATEPARGRIRKSMEEDYRAAVAKDLGMWMAGTVLPVCKPSRHHSSPRAQSHAGHLVKATS